MQDTCGWLLLHYSTCWLYTLHLYIASNFRIVKVISRKLVAKFQGFYSFRFLLHKYFFFDFLWQTPPVMMYSEQPTVLLAQRHLNTMLLTNFENLISILNIFREAHDFLVLTDPVIVCIYLRTTGRHFRDQRNVLHLTLNLLKSDLFQTLNTFQDPSLRIFAAAKASFVIIQNYSTYCYIISAFWRILIENRQQTRH